MAEIIKMTTSAETLITYKRNWVTVYRSVYPTELWPHPRQRSLSYCLSVLSIQHTEGDRCVFVHWNDRTLDTVILPLRREIPPLAMHFFVLSTVLAFLPIPKEVSWEKRRQEHTYTAHFIQDTKAAVSRTGTPFNRLFLLFLLIQISYTVKSKQTKRSPRPPGSCLPELDVIWPFGRAFRRQTWPEYRCGCSRPCPRSSLMEAVTLLSGPDISSTGGQWCPHTMASCSPLACFNVQTQPPLQGPQAGAASPPFSLLMIFFWFFVLDLDFQGKSLKRPSYNKPSPQRCK